LGAVAEGEETAEGAVVLAVETGFGVADVVEVAGGGGEVAEGDGGLGDVVFGGEVGGGGGAVAELVADGGFFEAPGAELTPAGDGEGFDELAFDGGGGLELGLKRAEEADETVFGFVVEDDGSGEEAVFQAVLRGILAAFAGDGAFGFGSVAAGDIGSGFGIF